MRLSKTSRGRLERGAVLAATVGLHAVVLFLLTRPVTPDFPDHSNDEDAIDITLDRARRPARAAGRTEAPSSAPHRPVLIAPGAVETAAIAPALAAPTAGPAPPASGSGARGDLGAALRTGGLACSGDLRKMLGPEERARCDERFGALARNAPDLPAPIDPGKRAYYDAIAEAYRDHGPVVPLTARGAGGIFGAEEGVQVGHGPRVGCSVKFGPNASKAPKGPANALRAGPCFIQPPLGSLTPEADIRKPY